MDPFLNVMIVWFVDLLAGYSLLHVTAVILSVFNIMFKYVMIYE